MTKSKLLILLTTTLLSGFAMEGSTAAAARGAGAEDVVMTIDLWFKTKRGRPYTKPFDPDITVVDAVKGRLFSGYLWPFAFRQSILERLDSEKTLTLGSLYAEGCGTKEHPFIEHGYLLLS